MPKKKASAKPSLLLTKIQNLKPAGKPQIRNPSKEDSSYHPDPDIEFNWAFPEQNKPPRDNRIRLIPCATFSDRGMKQLFYLGMCIDEIPFYLHIWQSKDGRALMRLKSDRKFLDSYFYEIHGWNIPPITEGRHRLEDSQVPWIVKAAMEEWVTECLENPYGD